MSMDINNDVMAVAVSETSQSVADCMDVDQVTVDGSRDCCNNDVTSVNVQHQVTA